MKLSVLGYVFSGFVFANFSVGGDVALIKIAYLGAGKVVVSDSPHSFLIGNEIEFAPVNKRLGISTIEQENADLLFSSSEVYSRTVAIPQNWGGRGGELQLVYFDDNCVRNDANQAPAVIALKEKRHKIKCIGTFVIANPNSWVAVPLHSLEHKVADKPKG